MVHTPANTPPPKSTVTLAANDSKQWSLSISEDGDVTSKIHDTEDDGLEFFEGQLAMYLNTKNNKTNEFCFIWHIFDEGVHLRSMTDEEYFVDADSENWYPIYKDNKPVMAKKNIFGFYKKKFWEV